ncbi:MAG: putative toxin-antitoxin system toxin component, PIN family [Schwartzia sp.]|nr:putative toxin-antitoxin system toxin component, PIN family [Schwartzia sp. (in: firmicutes)]
MKIVIDTSVVVSAFFFGGPARQLLECVMRDDPAAYATREIAEEYEAAIAKMQSRKKETARADLALPFIMRLHIVVPKSNLAVCRNPGEDKFVACAMDSNAVYVVDDDQKVSFNGAHRSVKMMTAEACCQLLSPCGQ